MTNNLSQIVNVDIRVEQPPLTPAGFGRAAIVGEHTRFAERYRLYSGDGGLEAMLADGFLATDAEYIEAAGLLGQVGLSGRRITDFVVGRRDTPVAQVTQIVIGFDAASTYELTFSFPDRPDVVLTVPANADLATTEALMNTTINGNATVAALVTSIDGAGFVEVTSDRAGAPFTITGNVTGGPGTLTITTTTANVGIQEDLAAMVAANADWYATVLTSRDEVEISLAARWTETASPAKFFLYQSNQAAILAAAYDILDPFTDVMSELKSANLTRTHGDYHAQDSEPKAAALAGYVLPFTPGTINWANLALSGLTANGLTATEMGYLFGTATAPTTGKNGNALIPLTNDIARTLRGLTPSGRFADITRAVDYIDSLLTTAIANLVLTYPKIPYDQSGLDRLEATMRSTLEPLRGTVLASDRDIVINIPRSEDISATDRANRVLTGITFALVLSGALNHVIVNGTVS